MQMTMAKPPRKREPILQAPASVLWLIAAMVAVHVLGNLLSGKSFGRFMLLYGFVPARYSHEFLVTNNIDPGSWFDQALPFFSYMFVHADITHLTVNSLWLLAFGPVVARRFGAAYFLLFFLLCGLVAILTHLFTNWGSLSPVIGASGAISGLMGAAMRMLNLSGRPRFGRDDALEPLFSRQVAIVALVWTGINVVAGILGIGAGTGPRLIAWQAHLGGFFAGLLLVGIFDRFARRRRSAMV